MSQKPETKSHVLDCDKRHGHEAPHCCSEDCWCQEMPWDAVRDIVREVEHAARHESDFSDSRIDQFVDRLVSTMHAYK